MINETKPARIKRGDLELHSVLMASTGLDTACLQLVELANERGGEDNITVVFG